MKSVRHYMQVLAQVYSFSILFNDALFVKLGFKNEI